MTEETGIAKLKFFNTFSTAAVLIDFNSKTSFNNILNLEEITLMHFLTSEPVIEFAEVGS